MSRARASMAQVSTARSLCTRTTAALPVTSPSDGPLLSVLHLLSVSDCSASLYLLSLLCSFLPSACTQKKNEISHPILLLVDPFNNQACTGKPRVDVWPCVWHTSRYATRKFVHKLKLTWSVVLPNSSFTLVWVNLFSIETVFHRGTPCISAKIHRAFC